MHEPYAARMCVFARARLFLYMPFSKLLTCVSFAAGMFVSPYESPVRVSVCLKVCVTASQYV